jgi:hypothetical protein
MPEIVRAFLSTEQWHERSNCSVEAPNGSLGGFAQQGFKFAVRHLDGVEVGRVLRQVANRRSRFLDRLSDAGDLVGSEVVHHDDVVAPKRRNQALLDVGQEHLACHRPVDDHRRGHSVVAQASHKGDRLPLTKRHVANHTHAPRSAAPDPRHVGADRSFVDKHQPGGVKHALLSDPASPCPGDVRSLPFCGLQAFF